MNHPPALTGCASSLTAVASSGARRLLPLPCLMEPTRPSLSLPLSCPARCGSSPELFTWNWLSRHSFHGGNVWQWRRLYYRNHKRRSELITSRAAMRPPSSFLSSLPLPLLALPGLIRTPAVCACVHTFVWNIFRNWSTANCKYFFLPPLATCSFLWQKVPPFFGGDVLLVRQAATAVMPVVGWDTSWQAAGQNFLPARGISLTLGPPN